MTNNETLIKLVWTYILLLVFEGALRKWVVPFMSAPLLLVRDPIGIWIIWESVRSHQWPKRWSVTVGALLIVMSILCVMQVVWCDNYWVAGIYGIRSYFLPFPIAFAIGESLNKKNIDKISRFMIFMLVPMCVLYAVQYKSPSGSFWNAGAYEGASQIAYAGNHVRASGTFSYNIGSTYFSLLGMSFLAYEVLEKDNRRLALLLISMLSLVVSIPLIGARTLVYMIALQGISICVAVILYMSYVRKLIKYIIPLIAIMLMASMFSIYMEALGTMHERIMMASYAEGNTSDVMYLRALKPFVTAYKNIQDSDYALGSGMGRGAAAISTLVKGKAEFTTGETEIDRNIKELGIYVGTAFFIFRLFLSIYIIISSVHAAIVGDSLAIILAPVTVALVVWSVLEMPTMQGFMVVFLSITLGAINNSNKSLLKDAELSLVTKENSQFS